MITGKDRSATLRTVCVTGATSGIGRAIVDRLANDHRLLLVARGTPALTKLARELPNAVAAPVDLIDPHAIGEFVEQWPAAAQSIGIDVLIHCAGVASVAPIEHTGPDIWDDTLAVNLIGPAELTRVLLPRLRASSARVVFVNSTSGVIANPNWSAYAASKFGLRAFADVLRAEEPSLTVCSVFPSRTDTPMQRSVRADEGGPYEPEKYLTADAVAAAVCHVIDQPAEAVTTELVLRPQVRTPVAAGA